MSERKSSHKNKLSDYIAIEDIILEYIIDSGWKDYKRYSIKLCTAILKKQPTNKSDFQNIIYSVCDQFFDFNEISVEKFWDNFPWKDILDNQAIDMNIEKKAKKPSNRKSISPKIRLLILERDGYKCQLCGKTGKETQLEVDHKIPVSRGGKDSLDNLWTLCFDCNRGKSDLSIKT
jgi:hypothetical protein